MGDTSILVTDVARGLVGLLAGSATDREHCWLPVVTTRPLVLVGLLRSPPVTRGYWM